MQSRSGRRQYFPGEIEWPHRGETRIARRGTRRDAAEMMAMIQALMYFSNSTGPSAGKVALDRRRNQQGEICRVWEVTVYIYNITLVNNVSL